MSDFVVYMWDATGTRTFRKFITSTPDPSVTIDVGGLQGYRIRIKSNLEATALALAEVEVYGTRTENTSARSSGEKLSVEESENLEVKLYPNPTSGRLTLKTPNIQTAAYSLLDHAGKIIITGQIEQGTVSIDVSDLKSGVYFLKVVGGHELFTKKIIKH